MTGDMLNYAILNGLKHHIASYVHKAHYNGWFTFRSIGCRINNNYRLEIPHYILRWINLWKVGSNRSSVQHLYNNAGFLHHPNWKGLHLMRRLLDWTSGQSVTVMYRECDCRRVPINVQGLLGVLSLGQLGLSVEEYINSAIAFQISRIFGNWWTSQHLFTCNKCRNAPSVDFSLIQVCPAVNETCWICGRRGIILTQLGL